MKEEITSEKAIEELMINNHLKNKQVKKLDIRDLIETEDEIRIPIKLENCEIEELNAYMLKFESKFELINCRVKKFDVYGTYFLNGLKLSKNVFEELISFMHASHGINGGKIEIEENVFKSFVDLEDSIFYNKVILKRNEFKKGTNILSEMQLHVTFNDGIEMENNNGNLALSIKEQEEIYKRLKLSERIN